MYEGSEHFSINNKELNITMLNFWQWAYSDLSNNVSIAVFSDYIVATSLGTAHLKKEPVSFMWRRPYAIMSKEGYRVEVKTAAYTQSLDKDDPTFIEFRIAPARLEDKSGNCKRFSPPKRHSDVYVFSVYKGLKADESPLNLDLWEFYILPTRILDETKPTQKTLTLHSLMKLGPLRCDFYGIGDTIKKAMSA